MHTGFYQIMIKYMYIIAEFFENHSDDFIKTLIGMKRIKGSVLIKMSLWKNHY